MATLKQYFYLRVCQHHMFLTCARPCVCDGCVRFSMYALRAYISFVIRTFLNALSAPVCAHTFIALHFIRLLLVRWSTLAYTHTHTRIPRRGARVKVFKDQTSFANRYYCEVNFHSALHICNVVLC